MRYKLLFLILFSLPIFVFSQGPLRVEFETDLNENNYGTIPVNDKLLIFGSITDDKSASNELWMFSIYNKYLERESTKTEKLLFDLDYVEDYNTEEKVFILLFNTKQKNDIYHSKIVIYNKITNEFSNLDIAIPEKSKINGFVVLGDKALIGIEDNKRNSNLFLYDLISGEKKKLESNLEKKGFVEDIKIHNNQIIVILRNEPSKNENNLICNYYDSQGNIEKTITIDHPTDGIIFNNGQYFELKDQKALIVGTFFRNKKGRNQDDRNENVILSTGVYLSLIEDNMVKMLRFHSFAEFQNLYSYINEATYASLGKQMKRKTKSEKEFLAHFSLLLHDIIEDNGQLIMIGETYYPEFRQERRYNYDYYGRVYPTYYQVFEGYRFNNAIIASFNANGDILWNNGMNMEDVLSYKLYKRASVINDSTGLFMSYIYDGRLLTKFIDKGTINNQEYITPVEMNYQTDMMLSENNIEIEKWYNDFYIIKGYQNIRNNNLKNRNKRNVFFVSKLILQ